MALAYAQSRGDGVTRIFNVNFPYLSQAHIQVKVNGTAVAFTWLSNTSIQLANAPADGSVVDVRRVTPRDNLLVDWVDGSTLVETDLDLSSLQVFYLAQEAFDQGEASLGVADDGSYSALTRRISSLADPIYDQDAVTKKWVITDVNSNVVQARAANTAAQQAKTDSQTALTNTQAARADTYTARDAAIAARTAAESARDVSNTNKGLTADDRAATAADRVQTGQDRTAAAQSAAAAAQSAQQAALFDPSSYYTKTEITQNYYSKTDVDSKVSALNTAINGKQASLGFSPVNKAGDTMTGTLVVQKTDTVFQVMNYPNVRQWSFRMGADGRFHIWDDSAAATRFSVGIDGTVSTAQLGDLNTRIENRAAAYSNNCVQQSQMAGYVEYQHPTGSSTFTNSAYVITMTRRNSGDSYSFGARQPQLYVPSRGWFAAFPF